MITHFKRSITIGAVLIFFSLFSQAAFAQSADISADLSPANPTVVAGSGPGNLVIVGTITNNGPDDATGAAAATLLLPDPLPPGVTVDDITVSAGSQSGPSWVIGPMLNGASETITVTFTVGPDAPESVLCDPGTSNFSDCLALILQSQAGPEADPDVDNDTAFSVALFDRQIDMSMAASDTPDPVTAGSGAGNLVHTLTATNNGPSDASGVEIAVTPVLPAGVSPDSVTPDIGSFDLGTGIWTIGDHPAGVTATLTITLTADASTAEGTDVISATGTVTANETEIAPGDETAVDPTSVVRLVDMQLTAVDAPDPVLAGSGVGNLVHTLTAVNNGVSDASGVEIAVVPTIPATGVTPVSIVPDIGAFDIGTGIWTIGDHPVGVVANLAITLTVDATAAEGTDVIAAEGTISSNETDSNPENNTAVDPTSVVRDADLGVSFTESIDPVVAGSGAGNLVYVGTVTNNGLSDASGVVNITAATVPAGVNLDSVTPSQGAFDPGTGIWTVGDLAAGASADVTVTFTVDATAAEGVDVVGVNMSTAGAEDDSVPDNNFAEVLTSIVREVDMVMTAVDAPDPVVAGSGAGNLVHTLTATNNGVSDASGVEVTVVPVLPAGVTPDSAVPDIGSFDLGTGIWTIGDHPVGVTATLTITLTVDSSTAEGTDVISATGTVTSNETDTNPDNNTAVDPTSVIRIVDMVMTAVDAPDPVIAGSGAGNLVHTLTATNDGPSDASGVEITIVPVIPADVALDSGTADIGAFDAGTGIWTIGDHPAGVTATLTLTLTVGPSAEVGTDVISATGTVTSVETDSNPDNNTAVDPTSVIRISDLSVEKVADPTPEVVAGTAQTYNVTVTNAGPSDADMVDVIDVLTTTAGTTLAADTSAGGCVESPAKTITCDVGTITVADGTATFDIVIDVPALTPHNTALANDIEVSDDRSTSTDENPDNDGFGPVTTTIITQAYWEVNKFWNRGGAGSVTVSLTCDGVEMDGGVVTPGTPVDLVATGFDYQSANCVVVEEVPGGTFEEYSEECDVDPTVSSTEYFCDIGNSESFATFAVRKRFMDGNDVTPVTFHMDCNNGLPTEQQLTVIPDTGDFNRGDYEVNFVVTKFAPGQMDCTVYEEPVAGYTASYVCGSVNNPDQECTDGEDSPLDDFGTGPCFFEDVDSAGAFDSINYCTIRNYPNPGEIEITKEWIVEGSVGNVLDLEANIEIISSAPIAGGTPCRGNQYCTSANFYGPDDMTHTFEVETSFTGTVVTLDETLYDNTFDSENDCGGSLRVFPTGYEGDDGSESCTFTNTAFFEGIPTLNQWGMLVMILLTLGVGMIGLRRFS